MVKKLYLYIFTYLFTMSLCSCNSVSSGKNELIVVSPTASIYYLPQYVAYVKDYYQDASLNVDFKVSDNPAITLTQDFTGIALISISDIDYSNESIETCGYFYYGGNLFFTEPPKNQPIYIALEGSPIDTAIKYIKLKGYFPDCNITYNSADTSVSLVDDTSLSSIDDTYIYAGSAYAKVPYCCYAYSNANENHVAAFENAIIKAVHYINNTNAKTLAKLMKPFFKNTKSSDLEYLIDIYKENNCYCEDPKIGDNMNEYLKLMRLMCTGN